MQGLTYLKRMGRRDKADWGNKIMIALVIFSGGLLLFAWGYGTGYKSGNERAEASLERAMRYGYGIGVDKGLEALEEGRRK